MATSDSELITEARALTDYDQMVMSDAEFQELVDLCKEELRADFGDENYTFYSGSLHADRALFWFVCIAAKIRAGELAGLNISIGDIESRNPAHIHHETWFKNFIRRRRRAQSSLQGGAAGPAQVAPTRDERTYGDQ